MKTEIQTSPALTWELYEEGENYMTIQAANAREALAVARKNVDRANYPIDDDDEPRGTIWINVFVRCVETDEEEAGIVACDPEEPPCVEEGEHDYATPYALLGGLRENPGVWGHGAGLISKSVCMRCGTERTRDTWAQDPETGCQGLHSVKYAARKYADRIWYLTSEQRAAVEAVSFGEIDDYYTDEAEIADKRDAWDASAAAWAEAIAAMLESESREEAAKHLKEASRIEYEWGCDPSTAEVAGIVGL